MFSKQRALIIALDAIIRAVDDPESGYRWVFDARLPGLLRDYKSSGYRLVGILDPMSFGLFLETDAERAELADYINTCLAQAQAPHLDAIHIADDLTDPRPIWNLRRRFNLSLKASTLVGTTDPYEDLQKNAGIGHYEWASDLLGAIYPPNAQALAS